MRTLDSELYEYFQSLPENALEQFSDISGIYNFYQKEFISFDDWISHTGVGKSSYNTRMLKDIATGLSKQQGISDYEGFDDIKALEGTGTSTGKDSLREILIRNEGDLLYTREIPTDEVQNLAREAILMQKGSRYAESLKGKNLDELDRISTELHKQYGNKSDEVKYKEDSKYGINFYDKHNVIDRMRQKVIIKQLVENLPKTELAEKREQYEDSLNSGEKRLRYYSTNYEEMNAMLEMLFGKDWKEQLEGIYSAFTNGMPMIYIEQAFDERQQELESKKSKGLFARIKNLFTRNKQKKLPAPESEERGSKTKNEREAYFDSLRVEPNPNQRNSISTPNRENDSRDDRG